MLDSMFYDVQNMTEFPQTTGNDQHRKRHMSVTVTMLGFHSFEAVYMDIGIKEW